MLVHTVLSGSGVGKCLVIAGTPGVGKTTVGRALAEKLGGAFYDLGEVAIREGAYLGYDHEAQSYVIDEGKVAAIAARLCSEEGAVVIATHYPEVLDPSHVDAVVVLRLDPRELRRRLSERGWPRKKVAENVMAEALSVVLVNALSRYGEGKVFEVDVTGRDPGEVVEEIVRIVASGKWRGRRIDWLESLDPAFLAELEADLDAQGGTI